MAHNASFRIYISKRQLMNKKEKKYIMSYRTGEDSAYEKWAEKTLAGECISQEELEKLAKIKKAENIKKEKKDR